MQSLKVNTNIKDRSAIGPDSAKSRSTKQSLLEITEQPVKKEVKNNFS